MPQDNESELRLAVQTIKQQLSQVNKRTDPEQYSLLVDQLKDARSNLVSYLKTGTIELTKFSTNPAAYVKTSLEKVPLINDDENIVELQKPNRDPSSIKEQKSSKPAESKGTDFYWDEKTGTFSKYPSIIRRAQEEKMIPDINLYKQYQKSEQDQLVRQPVRKPKITGLPNDISIITIGGQEVWRISPRKKPKTIKEENALIKELKILRKKFF